MVHLQVVILVVDQQQRPELPEDAAELPGRPLRHMRAYTALMRACWATDPAQRPTFAGVISRLRRATLAQHRPSLLLGLWQTLTPETHRARQPGDSGSMPCLIL